MGRLFASLGSLVSVYCPVVTTMHKNTQGNTVSRAAAQDLANTCHELGLISNQRLKSLGLENAQHYNLDDRIPESTLIMLWRVLAEHEKASNSGLKLGHIINPTTKGLLASWISQAGTLREALRIFTENIGLMNPSESWVIHEHSGVCLLRFQLDPDKGYPDIAIERSMSALVTWARALSNHSFPINKASFTFKSPRRSEPFAKIFGDNVAFGANDNCIVFESTLLELPVVSNNELLKLLVAQQAKQSLLAVTQKAPIHQKVQALIRKRLRSGESVTVHTICADLAMSRQTLYRQLKRQGTDFQTLLDQVRQDLALEFLKTGTDSGAISLSLGYTDTSSFYKAFKRWFGTTPSAYLDSSAASRRK